MTPSAHTRRVRPRWSSSPPTSALDVFGAVLRTNVLGAIAVSRSALDHFRSRGQGSLVIVGSLLGQMTAPMMGPYVISKAAVSALVRIVRQEARSEPNITVHGIYRRAANYIGRRPRVLPLSDSPAKVARAIVESAVASRSTERQVGLLNLPMLFGYRVLPRVFDALAVPLVGAFSFAREPAEITSGNVFDTVELPSDQLERRPRRRARRGAGRTMEERHVDRWGGRRPLQASQEVG